MSILFWALACHLQGLAVDPVALVLPTTNEIKNFSHRLVFFKYPRHLDLTDPQRKC